MFFAVVKTVKIETKNKVKKSSKRITVVLDDELASKVSSACEKHKLSMADIARQALLRFCGML
jgi:hypothetical protein